MGVIEAPLGMITLDTIEKNFRTAAGEIRALKPTSLTIRAGERIGIFGPSGAGKSTLLNILGLAEVPTSGKLFFEETRIDFRNETQLVALRRNFLGYVFQYFNLVPSMNAVENVMLPLLLKKTPWQIAYNLAKQTLVSVGLANRVDHPAHRLSGGEMQRVGIARAIVHAPRLLLADEPTGNLDSKNGSAVLDLLSTLTDGGAALVMVSHSPEALEICSRHISIVDGSVG